MKNKHIAIGAAVVISLLAASSYASPHWRLYQMRSAVEARDAQQLARHVDFPSLRSSVKIEVLRRLGGGGSLADGASNPFAAFGKAMAMAVIDPVVNVVVSPEGVAAMLESGDIRLQPRRSPEPERSPGMSDGPAREKLNYDLGYRNWNQVVVERADGGGVAFILKRDGWWSWKLAGVELRE